MAAWWPPLFRRAGDGDAPSARDELSNIINAAQTEEFKSRSLMSMPSAQDANAEVSKSILESRRRDIAACNKNDQRAVCAEVDSISMLTERYASQFAEAERIMQNKIANANSWTAMGAKDDRHYDNWLKDQAQVQKRLEIHWLDNMIDDPFSTLNFMARITTTASVFHGVGRTASLYRSMDKVYAKLHGVTLSGMIFEHVPRSIVGGSCVAVSATVGLITGNALANIVSVIYSGDITVPERTCVNIMASQIICGVFAGLTACMIARNTLTRRAMASVMAGFTSCATITGLYCGYVIYRPYAASRSHGLYEPYWHPWSSRMITSGGSLMTRGKYL